jgi:hypothetical protein
MLNLLWLFVLSFHVPQPLFSSGGRVAAQVTAPLVDFQVAQPPPLPKDAKQCTVQLLRYDGHVWLCAVLIFYLCLLGVPLATPLGGKSCQKQLTPLLTHEFVVLK